MRDVVNSSGVFDLMLKMLAIVGSAAVAYWL